MRFRVIKSSNTYPRIKPTTSNDVRRHWLVTKRTHTRQREDDKDTNLKHKISTLVMQTMHDTEKKIKSVQYQKTDTGIERLIELVLY